MISWCSLSWVKYMRADEIEDLVGIYESDNSIKCRDCMVDADWIDLKPEDIITAADVDKGDKLFYCDYCEKPLS